MLHILTSFPSGSSCKQRSKQLLIGRNPPGTRLRRCRLHINSHRHTRSQKMLLFVSRDRLPTDTHTNGIPGSGCFETRCFSSSLILTPNHRHRRFRCHHLRHHLRCCSEIASSVGAALPALLPVLALGLPAPPSRYAGSNEVEFYESRRPQRSKRFRSEPKRKRSQLKRKLPCIRKKLLLVSSMVSFLCVSDLCLDFVHILLPPVGWTWG